MMLHNLTLCGVDEDDEVPEVLNVLKDTAHVCGHRAGQTAEQGHVLGQRPQDLVIVVIMRRIWKGESEVRVSSTVMICLKMVDI